MTELLTPLSLSIIGLVIVFGIFFIDTNSNRLNKILFIIQTVIGMAICYSMGHYLPSYIRSSL
ncbi:hypothetical protein A9Q84_07775 [Halobacteriovorax marinus]|uniref:Uncharacterized protein n=1 Tax=Halobacteriovorax marinus TaxID=97084 RepID=A0A1Y5F5S7_9BACT|nr:hypothetical protein A9Q84_07775 [Halobacteriovorax marinus]